MDKKPLLPTIWPVVPLGRIFEKQDVAPKPGDGVVTAFRDGNVMLRSRRRLDGFTESLKEIGYQRVTEGDLVIHSMDAFAGAIGVAQDTGKSTPVYIVLKPKENIYPKYYSYVLRAYAQAGAIQSLTQGIRERSTDFRWSVAKTLLVPIPPYEDQKRIADELDRELAEIDEFIADQQRLLELEDERFKSTITSLVHPEPIKDIFNSSHNSVDWNGTTWRRTHLGMVTKVNEGLVDPREEPYSSMTLIAPNHVESGTGKILYTETAAEQGADSGKYLVNKGQVIFSKIRPTLLKSVIAPEDCLCSADMYAMWATSDYLTNEFLMWFLLSKPFETFARLNSDRVAMPKLNRETLSSTPIWIPDLEFQKTLKFKPNFDIFNLNETQIRESINLLQIKKKSTLQHSLTKIL